MSRQRSKAQLLKVPIGFGPDRKAAFLFAMLTQFKTEILIVRKFIPK